MLGGATMRGYQEAVARVTAEHRLEAQALERKQWAERIDQQRAHREEWSDLDRKHARDWFDLRRRYKLPIGPAGQAILRGVMSCTRR